MIYVLEDDNSIRDLIVYTLCNTGFTALGFDRPSAFWTQMETEPPSLLVLDIMLPEEDGLSVLSRLRSLPQTAKLPIILLTAKGSEYDKVRGLDAGADDYIPKPFGMMELVARIRALLRRTEDSPDDKCYTAGVLTLNPAKHQVKVEGNSITLTLKEYELLFLLIRNKDIVFTRDQLLDQIWGYSFDGESRTVDVHIRTLRQKLGDGGNCIKTVRGIGYCLEDKL